MAHPEWSHLHRTQGQAERIHGSVRTAAGGAWEAARDACVRRSVKSVELRTFELQAPFHRCVILGHVLESIPGSRSPREWPPGQSPCQELEFSEGSGAGSAGGVPQGRKDPSSSGPSQPPIP